MPEKEPGLTPKLHEPIDPREQIVETPIVMPAGHAEPTLEPEVPAFSFVETPKDAPKQWSEDEAQALLDAELASVEAEPFPETPVPENPFAAEVSGAAPAVTEAAVAEATVGETGPIVEPVPEVPEMVKQRDVRPYHFFHHQRPVYRAVDSLSKPSDDDSVFDRKTTDVPSMNEQVPQASQPEHTVYDAMDIEQLVESAVVAEFAGDRTVINDIHRSLEARYQDPSGTTIAEAYAAATVQFDRLVELKLEYEKVKNSEHHEGNDRAAESANKEPSIDERLKAFWKQGIESAKKFFRPDVLAEMWKVADQKLDDNAAYVLNYGIEPREEPSEIEQKRKRNRRFITAGTHALSMNAHVKAFGNGIQEGRGSLATKTAQTTRPARTGAAPRRSLKTGKK